MPIYEYECKCGNKEEHLVSMGAKDPKFCSKCNEMTLERVIGRSSFRLKGDGWFQKNPKP